MDLQLELLPYHYYNSKKCKQLTKREVCPKKRILADRAYDTNVIWTLQTTASYTCDSVAAESSGRHFQ